MVRLVFQVTDLFAIDYKHQNSWNIEAMKIHFQKLTKAYQKTVFDWLEEPHMKEFWDNSQEHKDDIINFVNGRIEPSHYFNGIYTYWIGFVDDQPFCFILTSEMSREQNDITELHRVHLSKAGHTITLDFGIGNPLFIGKGLASVTLKTFTEFFKETIDKKADTFYIDPNEDNPRAQHVYEQAGFHRVGEFNVDNGVFTGNTSFFMVKRIPAL